MIEWQKSEQPGLYFSSNGLWSISKWVGATRPWILTSRKSPVVFYTVCTDTLKRAKHVAEYLEELR